MVTLRSFSGVQTCGMLIEETRVENVERTTFGMTTGISRDGVFHKRPEEVVVEMVKLLD